jgi:acyl carrier protein
MAVTEQVRNFIVADLGWDGTTDELTDDLPLIRGGALDSVSILTLVEFLESSYGISIDDTEIVPDNLGTLASIERFVRDKKD